ncbi:MAG: ABC transporter permease [Alphaproteobacteria bacterium]
MIKFTLVIQSLLNRWLSCLLIILTLAFSISLFFTVSRIQESVRSSFQNTISGVDSVVAARGGDLQILLNSVFLIGEPNSTIRWSTFKDITDNNKMNWAVPITLGDSHKGYRVIGTTNNYFKEIKYSSGKNIEFLSGNSFNDVFDVVLGNAVANKLKYNLDAEIIITHGLSDVGEVHTFSSEKENHSDHADHDDHADEEHDNHDDHVDHDDHAKHEEHDNHEDHADEGHEGHNHENLGFKVTGILKPTGTPIDNAVYISLAGIEAMHTGWIGNQKVIDVSIEQIMQSELKPKTISAIFVSLKNRTQVFQFQRDVLNYKEEAISSVMPGITLSRLWALTGNVDKAFKIITFFIIIIALLGMIAMTIAGLNGRRREMAILRSVGASPTNIVSLLLVESIIISLISCAIGYILMIIIFSIGKDYLQNNYGIFINSFSIKNYDLQMIISIICAALIATIVPAIQIYKNTLRDGLNVRS